jgi:inner membrane protease ATP23
MATTETPDPSKAPSTAGADFLPGGDTWTRWRNFYRMASGRMSPEGQKKYWHDADVRYEAIDCKRCETQRDWLLQYSPIIRFMNDNIKQLGGDLGKHNIRCRRCETGMQGGFDKSYGIKLCANYVETRKKMEDTMAHEMVHAYDHLRFKVDWDAQDLRHVACTEVSVSRCPVLFVVMADKPDRFERAR